MYASVVFGDFNRLNLQLVKNHYHLKEIVKVPTRKNATLDLILTSLAVHYDLPEAFPPFGLSDHNTVITPPKNKEGPENTTNFILRRDLCPSCKAELGRYLSSVDWHGLFNSLQRCEELLGVFQEVITTGLDILMPLKRVRINTRDAPWMSSQLKSLIMKRQVAFKEHGTDSIQFKFHRNAVDRKRKLCKANFYETKVEQMKKSDPKS